jgi:hypothetical protein
MIFHAGRIHGEVLEYFEHKIDPGIELTGDEVIEILLGELIGNGEIGNPEVQD